MRTSVLCAFVLLVPAVLAQEPKRAEQTTYTYDPSGRRVAASYSTSVGEEGSGRAQVQTVADLNGRRVPLEASEETVLSDGPDGRVVERVVKKFDSQGRITGQEKVRIEESKASDGTLTVRATVYDRDLNGSFALRERTTTVTAKDTTATRAETLVERPSVNGRLEQQERRVAVTTGDDKNTLHDATVYRKDQQGQFAPAAREVTQTSREEGKVVANTSEYNTASTGQMALVGQRLSQTVKDAEGRETQVVDVYGQNNPGLVSSGYNKELKLRERQLIERVASGDQTVETFSVQRPALDSARLGPPQRISETVCTGNCKK